MEYTDKELEKMAKEKVQGEKKMRTFTQVAMGGFVFMLFGGFMLLRGMYYGLLLMSVGLLTIGIMSLKTSKIIRTEFASLKEYVEAHGSLPKEYRSDKP